MFASVGKMFSNVKSFYNDINPATLTGAIDIVVVEQPDGSYVSTPFHVRFGKLGVIRSKQDVVYIEINGKPIDLQMKLGNAGEAFFVRGVKEDWEGPAYLATSPIDSSPIAEQVKLRAAQPESNLKSKHNKKSKAVRVRRETEISNSSSSSASDLSGIGGLKKEQNSFGFIPISQQDDELLESGGMFEIEVDDSKAPVPDIEMGGLARAVSLPLVQESSLSRTENWAINSYHKTSHCHPYSDTDITPLVSPVNSRPTTPKSDTEYECPGYKKPRAIDAESLEQWKWGELPSSSKKVACKVVTQVDQPDSNQDPTEQSSGVQDTQSSGLWSLIKGGQHKTEGDIYLDELPEQVDSELAAIYLTKPRNSDHEQPDPECTSHIVNMSEDDAESGQGTSLPRSPVNEPQMERDKIGPSPSSDSGTMREHECGLYGDVAMSLCGGLVDNYNNVPAEIFEQHLVNFSTYMEKPTETLHHPDLIIRISGKYYNWSVAAPMIMSMMSFHQMLPENMHQTLVKNHMSKKQKPSRWWPWSRGTKPAPDLESGRGSGNTTPNGSPKKSAPLTEPVKSNESDEEAEDEKAQFLPQHSDSPGKRSEGVSIKEDTHYVKTLRLTSDEPERLNLHEGENDIEFSVTTSYQGTTRCVARIFLWKHTDKVIISDIDGTITKSDIFGHILPMVGKDWTHGGVTDLFTKISKNGYRFAYLSARAIGQAQMTRDYLRNVKQGNLTLPSGPVFLNPSSLLNAFHKEVIEKKPEEFKISCLSDIKSLFSTDTALYAGFGNRLNDIHAYKAVGIPNSRMFLIDPAGKLKSEFCETFQSSYSHLSDVTDHYFPPVEELSGETTQNPAAEFSSSTYWREPVPDISFILPE
ncbi:phosphatidate phosphatase LPIN3-like [Watersipora subatra]|uniref:phosphatidate phosphatase LPIN3-like n=1 Tax=Watersipora subatra TaxID=2589382 RepID=UPI00355BFB24